MVSKTTNLIVACMVLPVTSIFLSLAIGAFLRESANLGIVCSLLTFNYLIVLLLNISSLGLISHGHQKFTNGYSFVSLLTGALIYSILDVYLLFAPNQTSLILWEDVLVDYTSLMTSLLILMVYHCVMLVGLLQALLDQKKKVLTDHIIEESLGPR